MESVFTSKAGNPIGPYSQAMIHNGLVYTSGQIGMTSEGNLLSTLEDQTHQIFKNLTAILHAAGSSPEKIIRSNIYLLNMADFAEVNLLYQKFVSEPFPARSTIEVRRLPKDALIEIDVIATQT